MSFSVNVNVRARTQLDPKDTWTPGTLGPRGHLDPKDIWTPGTLGPWTFGPQDTWTLRVFMVSVVISHNSICSTYAKAF